MNIPQNVYMVGIGGIGMSALAQLFKHAGKNVAGSDREESPTTRLLTEKGVQVWVDTDAHVLKETKLLIYSDAVPAENKERVKAREMNIPQISYFEALGEISKEKRTIAVAGTHGKTTTTGMLAKVLHDAGKDPTAIIGSIVSDFGSNFLPGEGEWFVVEACEYRDHLLELSPEILVITNIELDHTDYFPTLTALQDTFRIAIERVPKTGAIIANPSDPAVAPILKGAQAPIVDYMKESVPELQLIGGFNALNARAAKCAARVAFPDLHVSAADQSLASFKGTWRRFEYKGETPKGALVFDDYAHHPTAIEETIQAVREKYPNKKIVVAFHPHLYSRTKSFLNEFAVSLAKADTAFVAPIYAAREAPDPSITNEALANVARARGGAVVAASFDEIREKLLQEDEHTLIVTMGAGDIYKVAEQITEE